jgi:hypothetical protein
MFAPTIVLIKPDANAIATERLGSPLDAASQWLRTSIIVSAI